VRPARLAAWALVAGLLALALAGTPPPRERPAHPALLGPFLELVADVQWVRFQRARLAGEPVRALGFAESALELAPSATDGWKVLAAHLALDLGSREREPDVEVRRSLLQAALAVLARGVERAADPGELELETGLILANKAELDPELDPGGARALFTGAAAAFERAARHGADDAPALLDYAREGAER